MRRIPNLLTTVRIAIVPVLILLLAFPSPRRSLLALLVFSVASFTDWLDGFLARRLGAESIVGRFFDPLADKVLVMSVLIMLAGHPEEFSVPAWIVATMLARDMLISGLRTLAATKQISMPATMSAKIKTASTMAAIMAILAGNAAELWSRGDLDATFTFLGICLLWIALISSLVSGTAYFYRLRALFA